MEGNVAAGDRRSPLADAVWFAHAAIVAFFLVACALPWRWAWWTNLAGAAVMHLQWRLNGDVCVLTDLERSLRGKPSAGAEPEGNFVADLAARIAGRPLPQQWTDRLAYVVLWGGAGIAGIRLAT